MLDNPFVQKVVLAVLFIVAVVVGTMFLPAGPAQSAVMALAGLVAGWLGLPRPADLNRIDSLKTQVAVAKLGSTEGSK